MRIGELQLQVHGMIETLGKSKTIQKIKYTEYIHVIVVACMNVKLVFQNKYFSIVCTMFQNYICDVNNTAIYFLSNTSLTFKIMQRQSQVYIPCTLFSGSLYFFLMFQSQHEIVNLHIETCFQDFSLSFHYN